LNQYLVLYKNQEGNTFQSIHTWAEIEPMLYKMEKVGGRIRIFRLNGLNDPYLVRVVHCKDMYWLETMNGIHLEG